ncbi:GAP family protein [Lentzea pudingi]|uniref:GAP family protein n=1 Tax=Lentzea pudingi TaxID=1789439 RepID=UPI00166E5DA7|nr:GAP family protein [Lentzea pudingi]
MSPVLLAGIVGLALLDALNPATIAGVALLLLAPLRRPVTAAVLFALGAYAAVFALGVVLLLGADVAAGVITDAMAWLRRAALLLGAGSLAVAGVRRFRTRTRTAVVLPSWVSVRTAVPLGVVVTGADLPNAFPYFPAVERLVTAGVHTGQALLVLAGYALIYCLPCLVLIVLGAAFGGRVHARLAGLYARLGAEKVLPANAALAVLWLLLACCVVVLAFLW